MSTIVKLNHGAILDIIHKLEDISMKDGELGFKNSREFKEVDEARNLLSERGLTTPEANIGTWRNLNRLLVKLRHIEEKMPEDGETNCVDPNSPGGWPIYFPDAKIECKQLIYAAEITLSEDDNGISITGYEYKSNVIDHSNDNNDIVLIPDLRIKDMFPEGFRIEPLNNDVEFELKDDWEF